MTAFCSPGYLEAAQWKLGLSGFPYMDLDRVAKCCYVRQQGLLRLMFCACKLPFHKASVLWGNLRQREQILLKELSCDRIARYYEFNGHEVVAESILGCCKQ